MWAKQFYCSANDTYDQNFPIVAATTITITNASLSTASTSKTYSLMQKRAPKDTPLTHSNFLLLTEAFICLGSFWRQRQSFNSLKSCIPIISLSFLFYYPVTSRDVRCLSENNLAHKWRSSAVICKKYHHVKGTPEVSKKAEDTGNIPFCTRQLLFWASVLFLSFFSNHFMLGLCRLRQTRIPEIAR